MPQRLCSRRTLELTPEERTQLEQTRDRDPRAYLRERAAALLKIADGQAPYAVARHALLKPRHPETVYTWLNDYQKTRTLRVRPACRGPFSPHRPRPRGAACHPASEPPGVGKDA